MSVENVEKLCKFIEYHHLRDYLLVEKLWKKLLLFHKEFILERVLQDLLSFLYLFY